MTKFTHYIVSLQSNHHKLIMKKKTIITQALALIALFIYTVSANADVLRGRVVDANTKEPLIEASIKLTQNISDNGYQMSSTRTDSLGVFFINARQRGTIEASMLGYYTKKKNIMAFSEGTKDTIDVGTIELKMSPQMLKMVEVKGHARRFTVKGDTIIFNPEAFHLQEGARLDDLIRKLPGVEMDDEGKLSWNGKPIRLTMDGESMLGGDQLMQQLPAEAVQNIKAYNKASEFSERTGKDDGAEDMVLDLNIKPGFLDRWYGDVTAGYQSPKYYESELTMNRLSKTDPVLIYADANNIDKRHRRQFNYWQSSWGTGFGQEHGATAGYQHKWNKKAGTQELKSQYNFTGGIAHNDDRYYSSSENETFFPNTAASRSMSDSYYRSHSLNPSFNADMHWAKDTLNTYSLSVSASHSNSRSSDHETTEQGEKLDGADDYTPVLSEDQTSNSESRETRLNAKAGWERYIKDGSLGVSMTLNHSDSKREEWTNRTITSHQQSIASSQLNQYAFAPNKVFSINAEGHHSRWLTKNWMMQLRYTFTYDQNRYDHDFFANDVADSANTYQNHRASTNHDVRLEQTLNLSSLQLKPSLSAKWLREHLDYERSSLDTTAVRRRLLLTPSINASWKITKTIRLEFNYGFRTNQPNLLQTIGFRDLTNPLYINEGNPDLKDSHTHDFSLNYSMVLARSQTSLSTTISMQTNDRAVTTALSYNPATAIYTSRPENVQGNKSWSFRLNIDQAFGDFVRLQNDFRMNANRNYGYLTLLPTQTERILNRQTSFNPREKLTLSYDKDWLKTSVFTTINAERHRFTASPEQNTTLWDNTFGFKAEITWGNLVFENDITHSTSRGYLTESMNRDRLLWNGSVTWKILKNKARVKFEFQDLLNNEDGLYCRQSAYQRSTSWTDFRHHYVGINFTYHLDAKQKD